MSNQLSPSQPEIPGELWMLWIPRLGEWVISTDDGPTWLVVFSEVDAIDAAKFQAKQYAVDCYPVRVK
jgi:hypothetical protein